MSVTYREGAGRSAPLAFRSLGRKAVSGQTAAPSSPSARPQASANEARRPDWAPKAAPLAMPIQDLDHAPPSHDLTVRDLAARRALMLAGSGSLAAATAAMTIDVLGGGGVSAVEGLLIAMTALLCGWVGFSFLTALAGFVTLLGRPAVRHCAPPRRLRGRTAILAPVYNEDPGLMQSNLQATAEELRRLGLGETYDLYILSDTRDGRIAREETAAFLQLRARLGQAGPKLYYRRRARNTDRKAGNIADWVHTFGGAYDYMLVLDADSLMSGECIATLTAEMDADPQLGLLQTVPSIVNAGTPFARLQQFANRLYGPILAAGQHWWSGSEGNYWGHNAIIRVAAFAESAGLPHLPGARPFGGHILSHDFVEAALLRRRGWAVRMVPELPGSYETAPPNLLDLAARDRRWCQGNLQHIRLIGAAGLHWVSRLHLARGVFTYLAPALWLAALVCGGAAWPGRGTEIATQAECIALFGLMSALLFGPKLMAYLLAMCDRELRAGFGGGARLTMALLLESLLSALTAPVIMLMQTSAVADVLLGRDSGWAAQRREGVKLSARQAWRGHRSHVALGLAGAIVGLVVNRDFLLWTSPVFLALTGSAWLSLHTSRASRAPARAGRHWLQIPEEANPPPILSRAVELRRAYVELAELRDRIDALFGMPIAVGALEAAARRADQDRCAA